MKKKEIREMILFLSGIMIGTIGTAKKLKSKIINNQKMSNKHLTLFLLMNQWVKVKQEGKNLSSYFEKKGYHEIAVYGMSYVGQTLVDELKGSNIHVKYGIDKNTDIFVEVEMVSVEDELEEVEAVVVTPVSFFDQIEEVLSEKVSCPIISLEDILYEI